MSPLITSDGIKSIVKIAELPSGELLIASSQLGLVSISHSHEAINLVHQNGQVFRKNIKSFGTSSDFGYAVGTKDQDFLIDLKTGEVKPFSFWENNSCIDELLNEISAEFTNTVSGYTSAVLSIHTSLVTLFPILMYTMTLGRMRFITLLIEV